VNLLTNARHAVESLALAGTGTDGVSGAARLHDDAAAPFVEVRTRIAGTHLTVTIQDRGVGISPEDMAHIFDPYFTTRRAGTGLGLPISKNIVEGLGGTLAVTSRRGEGTQIRIDLPLTPPEAHA
jgi:signal transduction histidine kinase